MQEKFRAKEKKQGHVVSVVEVLVTIQYSALFVRSGYTANVVVLRVVRTK